ncbi:MAG TPA: lipocalin family protein, partial [Gemmatimonadales bacterium]|nr:lipocalin family protein [Gemmatimonadales bacterium]
SSIRVTNRCLRGDGSEIRAVGKARLADRAGPASRLKVRFAPAWLSFLPMVWGDYWVLDLTDDYTVVLVGDPGRKYLWILARSPEPDSAQVARMVATAAAQGFDVGRLVRTP